MPAARSMLAATKNNNGSAFSAFKTHSDAQRMETKSATLTLIRNAYPDYHVTEVDEGNVSLREYAGTDAASITLDAEDDSFMLTRQWRAVGEGIEKVTHSGELRDEARFARYQYIWSDNEYIVYYVTWDDPFKPTQNVFYILYPRASSTITSSGNCPETDALILAAGKWTSQLHDEIFVFDDGSWDKSKALWESVKNASWSDVILEPQMKKNLIEDVQGFFDSQALYAQYAVPWKRGIILHGVPGNGKTVSIKALMSSLYDRPNPPIPSLYVKSFKTMCYTEQYAIHSIFDMARSMAPCLLIFEDLDSLVNDSVRSYFLNEVDGVESNDGILMIGSTNHLDTLDPAISKRPSRFDRKYHFKLPELEERKSYAEYWRGKLEKHNTVDFPAEVTDIIAQLTDKFSFAYLKELFVMALLSLVRGVKDEDLAEVVEEKKEDEKPAAAEPEKQEEEEKCTCVAKCKDCGKPLPKESAEAKDEKTEAKDEESTEKMVMPTVEIPEHLKENLLLKVIKHHIGVMIAEMDNTKDYEGKKKTEAVKESCCD